MQDSGDQIVKLPEGQLFFSEDVQNDRTVYDEARLEELAKSIDNQGLQYPPIVRPRPNGRYEVVAGHRRTLACRRLGWKEIPVIIRELTDEQAEEIMLVENTGRVDLDPMDEANAFARRMERYGWDAAATAEKSGKAKLIVERRLLLRDLIPELQVLVRSGQLPVTTRPRQAKQHAELVAELDPFRQRQAMKVISDGTPMSLGSFRTFCAKLKAEQDQNALIDLTELFRVQIVEEQKPLGGREADVSHLRNPESLPPVRFENDWTSGEVISGYISDLQAEGKDKEAAAIEKVYRALISRNWTQLPRPGTEDRWAGGRVQ
ncbi:MAG: ParB/RepB/Spo0J family partition protein [Chloroflexi bacterium]|nr:ParB/RepB/Spo0J family partition protein [Chloroflexota bacterium]